MQLPVPGYPCSIAVDPRRPDRLLVATGSGIEESLDRGLHWSLVPLGAPPCSGIAFDPTRADLLYGATGQALLRSLNAGVTWNAVSIPGRVISVAVAGYGVAFAVSLDPFFTISTLFRSSDRGETWIAMPLPGAADRIELDPRSPGTLYAIGPTGIFRSTDGGGTWEPRGTGNAIAFAIDPRDPAVLYAGAVRGVLWKSVDAGGTWRPTGSALPPEVESLIVDLFSSETVYAGLFQGGLFMSTDGAATWVRADRGLMSSAIATLALDFTNPRRVLAGTSVFSKYDGAYLFGSDDGGRDWASLGTFWDVSALAVDPSDPAVIFVGSGSCKGGGCSGGISKSSDGGRSWSGALSNLNLVSAIAVNPRNPKTVLAWASVINASSYGVLRSLDGGVSWSSPGGSSPRSQFREFLFDPANPSLVYAASSEGVFRSTDEGLTWTASSSGLTDLVVSTLAINPFVPRELYAGTPSGLFKTADGSLTWRRAGFASSVTTIAVDPVDPRILYVSGDSPGLYRSANGGLTWAPVPLDSNGGLSTARITRLAIDSAGLVLHAATDSGVWELELRPPVVTVSPRS